MVNPGTVIGGFVLVWFLFVLIIICTGILGTVFWILMIVDCAKRKFKNDNDKIVWIVLLALTHLLGATIYYFVVKRNGKK